MQQASSRGLKNLSETRSWSDFAPKAYWYICWEAKCRWLLHNLG